MSETDINVQYNLPEDVRFCRKCVISNQRPRMVFDEDGVCYACRFAEYKQQGIDWDARAEELKALCDKLRSKDGRFDVIVPSSGGKDSAYVAHMLKHEYGMHPLTITWAPHIYTDIGRKNFQDFIHSGFDNILGTPDGQVHRRLTKQATIELGDPFQPFIYGQVLFPLRMAVSLGIKLIFSGENGEAEYSGNPDSWNSRGFSVDEYDDWWFSNLSVESWVDKGFTKDEMAMYWPPEKDAVKALGVERHFFGYYHKWVPQDNFYYAVKNTGFTPNPDGRSPGTYSKYASLDDKIDPFHYYFMLLKFGTARATSDAAHEIRDGHITREEGVALVSRYDDEFPTQSLETFLDYCEMTQDEFWDICDRWRNKKLWEKDGNDWRLKYQAS